MLIPLWLLGLIFILPYGLVVIQVIRLGSKFRSAAWWFYAAGFTLSFIILMTRLILAMIFQQPTNGDAGWVRVNWSAGALLLANLGVPLLFIQGNRLLLRMFERDGKLSVKRILRTTAERFGLKPKSTDSTPPQ